ncbi:hypothetical protein I5H06_gp03 [Mycobacterium phage SirPhilip]|uniref:Uncharacterized protein n=1 Tax=Mycobacterium phage SirPhilip TaxID=2015824 RepID=A0A222ZKE7_9CAUD|nr:hypothetical protein I5H06_gp03 [Mycobacterium phage SirPhilip]ASR85206.1 hypothetical protein SEA_SIRPHILIP_3 [Mycobacterium phage SirPhilip]
MMAPRVGVVAGGKGRAHAIIAELGLANAVAISPRGCTGRGFALDVLVLDESCLPLSERMCGEVMPSLLGSQLGHVYELRRHTGPPQT